MSDRRVTTAFIIQINIVGNYSFMESFKQSRKIFHITLPDIMNGSTGMQSTKFRVPVHWRERGGKGYNQ